MFSTLWAKVSGILVLIAGALSAALLYTRGQRDRAKEKLGHAKAEAKSKSAVMKKERAVDEAAANAREQSNEVQREADKRPSDKRPGGNLRR